MPIAGRGTSASTNDTSGASVAARCGSDDGGVPRRDGTGGARLASRRSCSVERSVRQPASAATVIEIDGPFPMDIARASSGAHVATPAEVRYGRAIPLIVGLAHSRGNKHGRL